MKLDTAVATTILAMTDPRRSRSFYADVLGLPFRGTDADGKLLFTLAPGAVLALIQKPAVAQADHTALSFEVADIASAVTELTAQGVSFDEYDMPGLRTEDHVCVLGSEKAAWFQDPDGNILCLHEPLR